MTEKEWIWANECADWDSWMVSYICLWFDHCSCSPYQFCNPSWFEYLRLGTFGTPCVLCDFVSAISVDSVGHALAATVFSQ